jgi:threonine aldolase
VICLADFGGPGLGFVGQSLSFSASTCQETEVDQQIESLRAGGSRLDSQQGRPAPSFTPKANQRILLGRSCPASPGSGDVTEHRDHYEFASDNTAAICPEALATLEQANLEGAPSYGDDRWTARVRELVCEVFETDCEVFFVFNGTAANALALAQICQSFHSIVCHEQAHLQTDECGAPEFFTKGSKLLLVGGAGGKIDIRQTEKIIDRQPEVHFHKPGAISITQSTEFGIVYSRDEVAAIGGFAQQRKMFFHMDGARFANAVASLDCHPRAITLEAGVDVLCFGGTKNGVAAGELVVFFKQDLAREFDYRLKQAGQLASKMRFLAAQWIGLLTDNVWLRNARHANRMACRLAERLQTDAKIGIVFPVEANAVFVRMSDQLAGGLRQRGWHFYRFNEADLYRLMCSWSTTDEQLADLVSGIIAINR